MKLGSLKSAQSLDGELCVVSRDLKTAVKATHIAPSLREALEKWSEKEASLQKIYSDLNEGKAANAFPVQEENFHSALPRTWLFADGSAFIYHIKLVRMARKAPLPETLETVPLMYQGECGQFLAPTEDIPQRDFAHGTDFEGEVGVVTDFVPMGVTPEQALKHIKLFVMINDVSLRGLIPEELAQGFGFFQSKPASALGPFTVTADEFGDAWKEGRVHLPLHVKYNGQFFGKANAGAMHFHFGQLIAHAAKTRNLAAGSVIGSGTVSNDNHENGSSCLAEKRMIEQIETGSIKTPFMKSGDTVEMQMLDQKGQSIFGRIFQKVKAV
ncbi:fumarylacetoacetate hydrolase family protein [Bdellovibrio sp. 22V]|uniref:fumarylacetoacetate hydrolase family protein n=1 Tax=Bdellovibrio TaxID=958 RepID=UPI002543929D|nr:fumarylacetoacetate hydrolase family protein [Bdellovibrio sp. 22V]WII72113.1 fumarylacetoacetate hydrolase family protein [Bdellovibrio sp. 22V]